MLKSQNCHFSELKKVAYIYEKALQCGIIDFRGTKYQRIGNGSEHAYFLHKIIAEKMADCASSTSRDDMSVVNAYFTKFGILYMYRYVTVV